MDEDKNTDKPEDVTNAPVNNDAQNEAPQAEGVNNEASQPTPPAPEEPKVVVGVHGSLWNRFAHKYKSNKKLFIPLTILVIIALLFAVPFTRYPLLSLVLKNKYTVTVLDNKTNTPVSGAMVSIGGITAKTASDGKATVDVGVGSRTLSITKQYYKNYSGDVFVGISSGKNSTSEKLDATGRQVPIIVTNKITGAPVSSATISVLDTEAETGKDGKATIVLPTNKTMQSATISSPGYNSASVQVQVTGSQVSANEFQITPSGTVYYLSNLSGNIDVVSSNLDGTNRKTVLAGTGKEDPTNTVLLASRDWKYLALLSKRAGGQYPALYIIDTNDNNRLVTADSGSANFSLVGWSGDTFVYQVDRSNVNAWQSGATAIKSYNAASDTLKTLITSQASGTSNYDAQYQSIYSVDLFGSEIVYTSNWSTFYYGNSSLSGKQDTLSVINPDGSGAKNVTSLDASNNSINNLVVAKPGEIYFSTSDNANNVKYYKMDESNNVSEDSSLSTATFAQQSYPTYLISPSGSYAFWSEERDGKNTLFQGDYYGNNSKQLMSLSDYTTYGWYTDNYLLMEKSGSELYVMPAGGGGNVVKISNYYKPPQNYYGYGGGYGGL